MYYKILISLAMASHALTSPIYESSSSSGILLKRAMGDDTAVSYRWAPSHGVEEGEGSENTAETKRGLLDDDKAILHRWAPLNGVEEDDVMEKAAGTKRSFVDDDKAILYRWSPAHGVEEEEVTQKTPENSEGDN